jgi:hypothetical protein
MSGRSQEEYVTAEIDPHSSPDGYNRAHDADPAAPGIRLRQVWTSIPAGPRLVIPIALLLAVVIAGFYAWVRPSHDDWSLLPSRLVCQAQSGPTPPPAVTVASVDVAHPRGNVLQLVVRFAQPLPPSPDYQLTYSIANNGTPFAVLNPRQGSDDLAIQNVRNASPADIRSDKATHAGRTAPDRVEISLDLTKFGIDEELVYPVLTVSSAGFAMQICHG